MHENIMTIGNIEVLSISDGKLEFDSKADAVLLARELLRNPYWPIHAREELDDEIGWPTQYLRGRELQQLLGRG